MQYPRSTDFWSDQYPDAVSKDGTALSSPFDLAPITDYMIVKITVNDGDTSAASYQIGRADTYSCDIDVAEIIGYDSALSSEDEALVGVYLADKYNLTAYKPQAKILTFGPVAVINQSVLTIAWTVPFGTAVSNLAPEFTISTGATCYDADPAGPANVILSGATRDFTSPQHYWVKASDNAITNDYTVTVTVAPASTACDILSFGPNVAGSSATIDTGAGAVAWTVPFGTAVTTLAPTYTVSDFATGTPASGTSRNFTTPQVYTVTAQDGSTTKDYTVMVTVAPPPPGGVGDGLVLWMDAAQIIGLNDGDPVATWVDISGHGNNAAKTGGSPTYKTGVLNGQPVIRFVRANGDAFTTADLSSQFPSAATVFIVTTINPGTAAYTLLYTSSDGGEWWRWDGDGNSYPAVFRSPRVEQYCAMPDSGSQLFAISSSSSAWQMWINGTGQGDAGGSYNAGGVHVIGSGSNGGNLDGDIAEVIEFSRALTSDEMDQVGGYLADKYGLTTAYPPPLNQATMYTFGPGAVINQSALTIAWTVPFGTDVSNLAPEFTMSSGATCYDADPAGPAHVILSGATRNFTSPQHYWVKSSDNAITNDYTVTVLVATTTELVSSLNPSTQGDSVTFTATVKAGASTATDATGICQFKVDGAVVSAPAVSNGMASYTTSDLSPGDRAITAVYSGDGSYGMSSGSLTQTVIRPFVFYSTRADGKTLATFAVAGSNGTWTVPAGVTHVEVLVVGGGGGAWDDSFQSGSGAGGMYYTDFYAVTPGSNMSIAVGAGATQGTGTSSYFGTQLIAYGGTQGNGYTDGGDQGGYSLDGGTTTNDGNLGMHYSPMDGNWCSGGGAGHAGYKGDAQLGGEGAACAITGTTNYYAGGGGAPSSYGSSGGTGYNLGWGGSGPTVFGGRAFSGAANTGGGGGGGWGGGGGDGGSGIIILAYQVSSKTPTATALASSANPSTNGQTVVFTATVKTNGVTAADAMGDYIFAVGSVNVATQALVGGSATYTNSAFTPGPHAIQATYTGDANYDVSTASLTQTNISPFILTFDFGALGAATITNNDIAITVPYGTDVTSLAPTYTLTPGALCDKASGSTQDFSGPVTYAAISSDYSITNTYTVTVNVTPAAMNNDITSFSFGTLGAGNISGTNITLTVPFGTVVTSLAPTYTVSDFATGNPVSGTSRDFTTPQTYTVTAQDTSTQDYLVTVSIAPFVVYSTREDGYTIATFAGGSGTWTVPAGVSSLEVLVVGGGGGAWNDSYQSGSGAGGMYYTDFYAVTPGSNMSIAVGAGATQGTGSSSYFGTQLIAYGGTQGNGYTDGGDQGGYSLDGGTTIVPGNLGMHYNPMDGDWCSGGGAGHAGYKGDVQLGGEGAACVITGTTDYYAGGGGAPSSYGSSGGTGYNLGWGGSGPTNSIAGLHAFSGKDNTGGGGGGGWGGGGGAGGSGVIILAYYVPTITASFTAAPTNGFAPMQVVFTDTSTGDITNRHWEFGDGNTLDTTNTSVTNTYVAGVYDVSLTVTDSGGYSAGQTNLSMISVASVPAPGFQTAGAVQMDPATGLATFKIEGINGVQYQIVYKDDLMSMNDWQPVDPPGWVSGTNGTLTLTDSTATNSPQRFYRIESKSVDAP